MSFIGVVVYIIIFSFDFFFFPIILILIVCFTLVSGQEAEYIPGDATTLNSQSDQVGISSKDRVAC